MYFTPTKPIAIIGGGPAGLTAANFLRRHNVPFKLYEAGKKLAGLATSFHDEDGFTYDFGAHFITNRLAAATGIGAYCRDVSYYGESVRLRGKNYHYPFGLMQDPRYLLSGLASRFSTTNKNRTCSSAAEWFRSHYGKALSGDVIIPLLEAWSGVDVSNLAASVGDKLDNSSVGRVIFLKMASRITGRAVASGYSREVDESPYVWHVYPEKGIGLFCEHLARGLEDLIQLESPVEEISVSSGRVESIRVKGQEQPVSAVISTAPCNILAKMVKGTDALQPLLKFRYRPMILINLRLEGRGLLPDTVLWTPEQEFPFLRLTETTRSMPWLAPSGKTLITVDIGCQIGDQIWSMDDESLGEFCITHLKPIIADIHRRYLGCRVLRTPVAYPIFLNEYEEVRQRLEHNTGVEGLYTIGRNGEFSHMLMEDVYWKTLKKMQHVLEFARQSSELIAV
jgi:protoporphyrinogen/coproporphyrinogen III oxidase